MKLMKRTFLVRSLALVYAVVLIGLAVYDEPLDTAVAKFLDVPKVIIPEQENAYFALLGFEAPSGMDITAAGLQKYRKVISDAAIKERAPDKKYVPSEIPDDRKLVFKGKDLPKEKLFQFAASSGALEQLAADNSELLERYRFLKGRTAIAEPDGDGYAFEMPFPMFSAVRNCQAIYLMQQLRKISAGDNAAPLEAICSDIAYWRGIQSQSRLLITRMIAIAMQKSGYAALSEVIGNAGLSPDEIGRIRNCLVPLTAAERDFTAVFRQEAAGMRDMYRSLYRKQNSFAGRAALRVFIKENATLNNGARGYMDIARTFTLPPEEFYRDFLKEESKRFDDRPYRISMKAAYNFGGEMLGAIALPTFSSNVGRLHELEALRRMVLLHMIAREKMVDAAGMAEFLKKAGKEYANPFTGEPMQWDEKKKAMYIYGSQSEGNKGKKRVELLL